MNPSWVQMMSNPQGYVIKQYMAGILKDKMSNNLEILERLGSTLITHNDMQAFGKLVSDVYQAGYMKAIKDHEAALAKLNVKVTLVQPEDTTRIFPQEKSG